jgi:phosphomannomutase/phosphoglucomutase
MLSCFKAYDIRGRIPDELNEDIAYRIGRAYAQILRPQSVVVGYDVRKDSQALAQAVSRGINDAGAAVIDIGLGGTEEVYFQVAHRKVDGGIMVTASHNPMDYNGMKLVGAGSRPISGDSGLKEIGVLAESGKFSERAAPAAANYSDHRKDAYIDHLLSYIDRQGLRPLKIVVNAGNGGAGLVVDELARHLPFEFIRIHHEPDGSFPHGIPNPLLPENRSATADAVRAHGADFGIAWDGDFDRCFFFDSNGGFIEGYYIVGLLAAQLLERHPGGKVIHDPRLTWNTIDMVRDAGGIPIMSKTGHAFIKERMRAEDAVYGGEMSAHHYFREFAYCDSGMIPWLLVAERISRSGIALADMVADRMRAYPCSGEINFRVGDAKSVLETILTEYADSALSIEHTDGLSLEFIDWRFNVRTSNTEPLLRLNVESKENMHLLRSKTDELSRIIKGEL